MNDITTLQALKALAENDRACEASPEIELLLRRAFRLDRACRARRRLAMWSVAAAAVVVVVAAGFVVARVDRNVASREHEESRGQAGVSVESKTLHPANDRASNGPASRSGDGNTAPALVKTSPAHAANPAPARRVPRQAVLAAAPPVAAPPEAPTEMVTDFFPLLDPAPPFERGEILRVNLPASVMQTVGLPVREERLGDRVQADVLVGEEGLPRAIRFVRTDLPSQMR